MPKFIIEPDEIEKMEVIHGIEHIRENVPQRHEFEMLSGILFQDTETNICVGFHDVPENPFWARGHIPERPLMPGVMIVEAAAQLCTYCFKVSADDDKFIGFGGLDGVKFRGTVLPGERLYLVSHAIELRSRRLTFEAQAIVNRKLVFNGKIIGMHV